MNKKRVLIVTDSYPPEVRSAAQLMADLAEGLVGCGHEVTVATTVPGYNLASGTHADTISHDENVNGVHILRVTTLPHHRVNYIVRGINQLLLPRIFSHVVRKALEGPFDKIIVHSPPLSLALAASMLARRYEAQFIANVHDIFPQNGIDLVVWWQKPLVWCTFSWMERMVYARADIIVVPSENHAKYLNERKDVSRAKLRVISHWIDAAPFDAAHPTGKFRKAWGLENKFVFFFGGVLGPSQGLEMVINAAETFRETPNVAFLFVGDGGARQNLEWLVKKNGIANIIFKPFVTREEYPALLKEMDVSVATLTSRNTTPAVPAKLMGYMAAGIPVVVAVHKESDAIRIVSEAQCGFTAISSDKGAVTKAFRDAYDVRASLKVLGENGKQYLAAHFARERLIGEWNELFHAA